jgi:hydrogenase maturation protease
MSPSKILVAGVGYQFLRDLSVGPALVPMLRELSWPEHVEIEDLSFGPIAVVQRFEDRTEPYQRIVVVSSVERGREPGRVYCYRWSGELPNEAEIQARIGEAVTGVISLDNLLVIAEHFGVLPEDVFVVEVEPEDTGWGDGFTPRVEASLSEMIETVRRLATEPSVAGDRRREIPRQHSLTTDD